MRRASQFIFPTVLVLLLFNVGLRFDGTAVWDDAHFFARYADNFLEFGNYAWNPRETPTYGLTAPLFGAVVLVGRALGGPVAGVLWGLSALFGGVAVIGLRQLWREGLGKYSALAPATRGLWWGTVAVMAPSLAMHMTSGMETTLAVAWMAGYLTLVLRHGHALSPGRGLFLGILGGMVYLLRPELLLFTVGVPLALAIGQRDRLQRRQAGYFLLFTTFFLLASVFFAQRFFGSLLPLSFYVKTLNPYGPEFTARFRAEAFQQSAWFLLLNVGPVLALGIGLATRFRRVWRQFSVLDRALLVLWGLFWAYETWGVLPVMGYGQRFHLPGWLVLLYLGGKALAVGGPESAVQKSQRVRWGVVFMVLVVVGSVLTVLHRPSQIRDRIGHFSNAHIYHQLGRHNWHVLDQIAAYPADLHLASTELGILGTLNPGRRVTDLSGLNDPVLARGFDVDHIVDRAPDLLYLPHPHNVTQNERLLAHPGFLVAYEVFPADLLGAYMGIALRRDGAHFAGLRAIVVEDVEK